MGMEAIMVPVVEQAATQVVDNTVRNALLIGGGIVLVGAATAAVVYFARKPQDTAITKLADKAASLVCADLDEVETLRAAAINKALAGARAEAAKAHPHELLDNPMASLVALTALNNNKG